MAFIACHLYFIKGLKMWLKIKALVFCHFCKLRLNIPVLVLIPFSAGPEDTFPQPS
jgi:hypothetical protein